MSGKFERMKNYIQKIEKCDFECKVKFLEECQDWIELKKEIDELGAMGKIESCCVDTAPKNHIERMEEEAQELEVKIKKLEVFLEKEKEEPKYTDDIQRILLENQKEYMKNYARILKHRIFYDTKKQNNLNY